VDRAGGAPVRTARTNVRSSAMSSNRPAPCFRVVEGISNLGRKFFQSEKRWLQDPERSEPKHTLIDEYAAAAPGKNYV
jgi:hypothetical protein